MGNHIETKATPKNATPKWAHRAPTESLTILIKSPIKSYPKSVNPRPPPYGGGEEAIIQREGGGDSKHHLHPWAAPLFESGDVHRGVIIRR